tara:strand:+ start:24637 stop:25515 length:879 start_codon:yes stop_codon:yes gene_type:complete
MPGNFQTFFLDTTFPENYISVEYNNQCTLNCSYFHDYGSAPFAVGYVADNNKKATLDTNDGKKIFTLISINAYKIVGDGGGAFVQNNMDGITAGMETAARYNLVLYHTYGDDKLFVIIPFYDMSTDSANTLDLNNIKLNNIIPESEYYFNNDANSNYILMFPPQGYKVKSAQDDPNILDTTTTTSSFKVITSEEQTMETADDTASLPTDPAELLYNPYGTKSNAYGSSANDIWIDCTPTGASDEQIMYKKKRSNLFPKVFKLNNEHVNMFMGVVAGLISIGMFNAAFSKLVK